MLRRRGLHPPDSLAKQLPTAPTQVSTAVAVAAAVAGAFATPAIGLWRPSSAVMLPSSGTVAVAEPCARLAVGRRPMVHHTDGDAACDDCSWR